MNTKNIQRQVYRIDEPVVQQGMNELHRARQLIAPGDWVFSDPFLLLAEDWFPRGVFDTHPHRGLETVTFVLEGRIDHVDNRGNHGSISPGDAQWMTAGRGILHNEVPGDGETVHSLQLWVNLPAADKMVEPRYQDLIAGDMPRRQLDGVDIRVFSGSSADFTAPTLNYAKVTILDICLQGGRDHQELIPDNYNVFLYILEGRGTVGPDNRAVHAEQVIWLDRTPTAEEGCVIMRAAEGGMRILLVGGLPLHEPVVARGPFVMNTQQQINQAYEDFHNGSFAA